MLPNLPTSTFCFTKEIRKNTKENKPAEHFGSHFSQNGLINLIFWPQCNIFISLSVDTHLGYSHSHNAIWLCSQMVKIWLYGHTAIWSYGSKSEPIWVSTERAMKIWHYGQKIQLIRPFCEKWEPKCSDDIFSFVFFRISFVKQKVDVGRLGSK